MDPLTPFTRRKFLRSIGATTLAAATGEKAIGSSNQTKTPSTRSAAEAIESLSCHVYPAVPNRLSSLQARGCYAQREKTALTLGNDFLEIEIQSISDTQE